MAGIRKEARAKARAVGHGTTTHGIAAGRATAQAGTATSAKAAVALPGEAAVRSDLVDSAVREINRIYVGKGIEAVRAIGECVLKTFFGGRTENFDRRAK